MWLFTFPVLLVGSCLVVSPCLAGSPPSCQNKEPPVPAYSGPDIVECECDQDEPSYIGNLNFLKSAIGKVARYSRNLEVTLANCESLEMELNLAEITYKQVNIKIQNSASVIINTIKVVSVEENPQFVILQNVSNFYLTGKMFCLGCSEQQGPLHLQFHEVDHAVLEDINSTVPMKVTARHLSSLSLYRTYIARLPWPGIFVYNATRVSISYSILPDLSPQTISMSLGRSADVSYNVMDVGNTLNIQEFDNVNEQCNRKSKKEKLSADCKRALVRKDLREPFGRVRAIKRPEPVLVAEDDLKQENDDELPELFILEDDSFNFDFNLTYYVEQVLGLKNDTIAITTLAHNGVYGVVFVTLCIIFATIFSLIYCCCQCCRRRRREKSAQQFLERQLSNHLTTINKMKSCDDGDEYSNSSKAHLAQGIENGIPQVHRFPIDYPQYPSLRYVTVQRVQADTGADGVICGSLTLTPSPDVTRNHIEDSTRDVSSNQLKAQAFNKDT